MIIHQDWASVAEHAQGSLITPAVMDENKRSGEGKEKERRQEFHRATTKSTVKSSPLHHPQPARLRQPLNLLSVRIARSSPLPWEGAGSSIVNPTDRILLAFFLPCCRGVAGLLSRLTESSL
ncbi:unnamed protein product [Pleuronectes platessa]|uniref:Uncharacterized protein n=1 Tax=Pleuronectes platessa TaxID=8262 RepID=A0A9N7Z7Y7_PLEPL|nr:unnamed protein product [Pleuronectes platessa]